MKKEVRFLTYFFAILILAGSLFFPVEAKADDGFDSLEVKFGKTKDSDNSSSYIFTLTNKGVLTIQNKVGKTQIYKGRGVVGKVIFNNAYAYFIQKGPDKRLRLMQVSTEGTLPRTLKTFDKKYKEDYELELGHIRGGYAYYQQVDFTAPESEFVSVYKLVKINILTGKAKTIVDVCGVVKYGEKRVIYQLPSSDLGPVYSYSVDYSGKKLKKSTGMTIQCNLDDGKAYVVEYNNSDGRCYAYSYNEDFTGRKKLSKAFGKSLLMVYKVDDEQVYYMETEDGYKEGGYYKFTYKTGKTVFVKGDTLDILD